MWAAGGVLPPAAGDRPRPTTWASTCRPCICTGLGVALCLPQLSSAAVQGLPADQFGAGSAVNQAVRNLGATLGVALVVAFTTDLTRRPRSTGSTGCGGCSSAAGSP